MTASCKWPMERFHLRGQHLCKFIGTKESVCIKKEFNSHRTGLPGTPTWPPFYCFGTPIWPPWRHVKTLLNLAIVRTTSGTQCIKGGEHKDEDSRILTTWPGFKYHGRMQFMGKHFVYSSHTLVVLRLIGHVFPFSLKSRFLDSN